MENKRQIISGDFSVTAGYTTAVGVGMRKHTKPNFRQPPPTNSSQSCIKYDSTECLLSQLYTRKYDVHEHDHHNDAGLYFHQYDAGFEVSGRDWKKPPSSRGRAHSRTYTNRHRHTRTRTQAQTNLLRVMRKAGRVMPATGLSHAIVRNQCHSPRPPPWQRTHHRRGARGGASAWYRSIEGCVVPGGII